MTKIGEMMDNLIEKQEMVCPRCKKEVEINDLNAAYRKAGKEYFQMQCRYCGEKVSVNAKVSIAYSMGKS